MQIHPVYTFYYQYIQYKTYLTDDKDKEINFNETVRIKCINKTEVNLPYKNPYEYPMGLRNIRMTCYLNSA